MEQEKEAIEILEKLKTVLEATNEVVKCAHDLKLSNSLKMKTLRVCGEFLGRMDEEVYVPIFEKWPELKAKYRPHL